MAQSCVSILRQLPGDHQRHSNFVGRPSPRYSDNTPDSRPVLSPRCLDVRNASPPFLLHIHQHVCHRYTPIPENEFNETILPRVYSQAMTNEQDPIDSHRLSIVFMVLALGTLLDLDLPALSPEASQFYQLGRTALSVDSILECQSIPAIQALVGVYPFRRPRSTTNPQPR